MFPPYTLETPCIRLFILVVIIIINPLITTPGHQVTKGRIFVCPHCSKPPPPKNCCCLLPLFKSPPPKNCCCRTVDLPSSLMQNVFNRQLFWGIELPFNSLQWILSVMNPGIGWRSVDKITMLWHVLWPTVPARQIRVLLAYVVSSSHVVKHKWHSDMGAQQQNLTVQLIATPRLCYQTYARKWCCLLRTICPRIPHHTVELALTGAAGGRSSGSTAHTTDSGWRRRTLPSPECCKSRHKHVTVD